MSLRLRILSSTKAVEIILKRIDSRKTLQRHLNTKTRINITNIQLLYTVFNELLIVTCMICLTRYLNSAQKFPFEINRPFRIRFFCLLTTSKHLHDKVSKAVPFSNRDCTF